MNTDSSGQNPSATTSGTRGTIALVAAATALLALAFGVRAVLGMFLGPLNSATGLGFASVSLALAVSQLVSGLAQPVCGAVSDRIGPARVVAAGAIALACGIALLPLAHSMLALLAAFSLLAAALGAVGSTPTLLGAVNARVAPAHVGLAAGIVSSGGALGQMALAPLTQWTIADFGWSVALYGLALAALVALPLAWLLPRNPPPLSQAASRNGDGTRSLRAAFSDARY